MIDFKEITIREKVTHRGGGVEVMLDSLGFEGECMTAYQNYLGGGMLGSISNDCTVLFWEENKELVSIADDLSQYFHSLTNHEDDWSSSTFEENQLRPNSAY